MPDYKEETIYIDVAKGELRIPPRWINEPASPEMLETCRPLGIVSQEELDNAINIVEAMSKEEQAWLFASAVRKIGSKVVFEGKIPASRLEERLEQQYSEKYLGPRKHCLLFGGWTDEDTALTLNKGYKTLVLQGVDPKNIILLDNNPSVLFDVQVDGPATKGAILKVIDYFSEAIGENDSVFMYFGGHGSRGEFAVENSETVKATHSTIPLWNEHLKEVELEAYLKNIDAPLICLFDPCYAGDFASRLGERNNIAMSSAGEHLCTYGRTFPWAFFEAFNRIKNRRVSIGEAFVYAVTHDSNTAHARQEPQIFYDMEKINPMEVYI